MDFEMWWKEKTKHIGCLNRGTPVWAVNGSFIKAYTWSGNWNYERCDLEDRKIHLTKDRAQAWADFWNEAIIKAVQE